MIRALLDAGAWCDRQENRDEVAALLSRAEYLDVPTSVIQHSLAGRVCDVAQRVTRTIPDFHVFHRYSANLPWPSQAAWLLRQMIRWQQLPEDLDIHAIANKVFRQDLFREIAAEACLPCPAESVRPDAPETHPDNINLGARGFMSNSLE